jgi:hypothetical protein
MWMISRVWIGSVSDKPLEGAGRKKGSTTMKNRILQECLFMAGEALGELRPVAEQVGDLSGIKPKDLSKEGIEKGKDGLVGKQNGTIISIKHAGP